MHFLSKKIKMKYLYCDHIDKYDKMLYVTITIEY